ncbi:MAG: entericidin A/B family lipoprotein [Chromatiales bacterium]|jgi:predicted small secreted protein
MGRLTYASLAFVALIVSACNTLEGAGEDIEAVGDEVEEEASEHKGY